MEVGIGSNIKRTVFIFITIHSRDHIVHTFKFDSFSFLADSDSFSKYLLVHRGNQFFTLFYICI